MAVSLNLLVGICGELSLGHAGFMGIGAFTGIVIAAVLQSVVGNNALRLVIAMFAGGIMAGVFGFLIGIPALRLRGDYLAIATLGFSEIIRIVITNAQSWTNGALGIKDIPALNDVRYIFIATAITFLFVTCLINSSYGRAFKAIREDEIAAEAMGVGLFKHKCMAFMLSAFFAGIGGGLYATLLGTVDPKNFLFTLTYNFLLIIVLGGMGSITGSMLGSIIVTAGLEYLRVFDEPLELFGMAIPLFRPGFRMVIFSVLLMACVLFWRKGIMGTNEFTWEKFMAFCKNPVKYFTQKGAK
jgi:branched-chain amino acid transport system permease protein